MPEPRTQPDAPEGPVAILGGCGHVGLSLGITLAELGVPVVLVDRDRERVDQVNRGVMPFLEHRADQLLPRLVEQHKLEATDAVDRLSAGPYVIVTVGTPVDEFLDPSVRQFDTTMRQLAGNLHSGQLVVLRSTVFPGVTEHLARLFVELGVDVDVAYCPDRIAQGHGLEEIRTLPQIVSGTSERAVMRASQLFKLICPETLVLRPVEAELAKLFTNAWRYINFAISNQFYILANQFDADFYKIHRAVCRRYPRMAGFTPAGFTAGPCLLKDTMQLAAFNHGAFPLGQAAMLVNESLPYHVMQQLRQRYDLVHTTVGILGMAFKANNDDQRSSLAYKLRKILSLECREVLCTDPRIRDPSFLPLETVLERADVLVLGACHDEYRDLRTSKPIIDVSSFLGRQ